MTQRIITEYGALDTSRLQNDRFANVIAPGVYSGYHVRPSSSAPNRLDIITGDDGVSVLVTTQGIRIEESESIIGELVVASADNNLERYDLVIAEYRYTYNTLAEQTYKIIRGKNATGLLEPEQPTVESVYQIPLAYVRIRPRSSFSGSYPAQILTTDILPVPKASLIPGVTGVAALKPIISPIDKRRLFIHAGTYTSSEGTQVISFLGGYTSVLEDSTMSDGDEKYVVFGLSDEADVQVLTSADTIEELEDLDNDLLPIARVKARKVNGTIRLISLEDIRTLFPRRTNTVDKLITYHALLAGSVFKYMRVETFETDESILLDSAMLIDSLETDELEATINGVDGTLTIEWTGATSIPTEDVIITTEDLMEGGNLGTIKHFMVAIDTTSSGITFQYSASSSGSGFLERQLNTGDVVRAVGTGARKLFLRFVIPASAFSTTTKQVKITSFCVLFEMTDSAFNSLSLNELGLLSFAKSIPNLIANGDFYRWSRNTSEGARADLTSKADLVFALNADNPVLADGWMVTNFGLNTKGQTVSRVIRDVTSNAATTGIEITTSTDPAGAAMIIEYRIPAAQELVGKPLTFAITYETGSASTLSIGIAQFANTSNGLSVVTKNQVHATTSNDDILVNSSVISADTEQISFFISIEATGAEIAHLLYNARAAVGNYNKLEFNKVVGAANVLRQYYERGRVFGAITGTPGTVVGAAAQFGTPKAVELGEIVVKLVDNAASNRSIGIGDITLDADADSVVATSSVTANGGATIDIDWEAYVAYEGSIT